MKNLKTIFASLALCLGIAATMSSCSDNDDKNPAVPAAKSVEGTYHGDMTCSVMGNESVFEDMTFTLTATDDATVSITISSFGNPPMQVPELTIDGVKVSGEDGDYTLASTSFEQESDGRKCSGIIQGSYTNDQITIQYNLQYGAMPMPMICSFTAPKN